jgi:hypothetical protein
VADGLAIGIVSLLLGVFAWQLRTLRIGVATGNLTGGRHRAYLGAGTVMLIGWITYLVLAVAGGIR